jgi:hypothetical protein
MKKLPAFSLQLSALSFQLSALSSQLSALSSQLSAFSFQLSAFRVCNRSLGYMIPEKDVKTAFLCGRATLSAESSMLKLKAES